MTSFILASFVLLSTLNMVVSYGHHHATHVSFVKNPDGTCFRRVITYENGKQRIDDQLVNCADMENKMKAEAAKTHHKINQDIKNTQAQIEDQIKNSMNSFNMDF